MSEKTSRKTGNITYKQVLKIICKRFGKHSPRYSVLNDFPATFATIKIIKITSEVRWPAKATVGRVMIPANQDNNTYLYI